MIKTKNSTLFFVSILLTFSVFFISCQGNPTSAPSKPTTQVRSIEQTATIPRMLPITTDVIEKTFSLPEKAIEILDLLSGSNMCQLPCFLGMNPGETNYRKAVSEMTRIATSNSGEVKSFNGKIGYNFKLYSPENGLDISIDINTLNKNEISDLIIYPTTTLPRYYSVSQVLSLYKRPDNILIFVSTHRVVQMGESLIRL